MPKLTFQNKAVSLEVEKGTTILEAALAHNIPLYHTCGGNASCSTCHVRVHSGAQNLCPIDEVESRVLEAFDLGAGYRLGCQAMMLDGDVVVEIPDRQREPRPNKTPPIPESP